ncbi:hypothetical protein [Pseudoflavitalea rhizosphaerae]|uniref:hypothetical protein n=1 Tax=Pseudoflavitalea rhizosphaerae TaxID=1884793 RepID=UPI000F8DE9CD|nr:hypothetical protein [Pseudoflavitalea rhizosphaerae]
MKITLLLILLELFCSAALFAQQATVPQEWNDEIRKYFGNWTIQEVAAGGRIDAIRQLDKNVVLCAARGANKGKLYISYDNGLHWHFLAQPVPVDITCIAETGNRNEFYILTGTAEVWGTTDGGKTWKHLRTLLDKNRNREKYAASYAIMYTRLGTLLVTDTDSDGGHIYRSEDRGRTWQDMGAISQNALYRLERTGNGIVVNGWQGVVYKSIDDGITWNKMQQLTNAALFATEYLGMSVLLQADQSGNLYRSTNLGYVWDSVTNLVDAADDFVNIGYGAAYYSTYTGRKHVYVTVNNGKSWHSLDALPTVANDWLDHGIRVETVDSVITLSGTNKGYIVRTAFKKDELAGFLYKVNGTAMADNIPGAIPLSSTSILGKMVDIDALNEPEDILYDNGFAYVPCRDGNNVAIIDCKDVKRPVMAHSLKDPDILDAFSVAIWGKYLYVLSMTNHVVSVYSIENPYKPVKVAAISIGGSGSYLSTYRSDYTRLRKIIIKDGYAYVTHSSESKLYILDIRKPAAPAIVSSFHTGDGAFAALVSNDVLYLAGYGPGSSLITVDVKDKSKPVITARTFDAAHLKGTCALAIHGNHLLVAAYNANKVWSFDITDPLKPVAIDTLSHPSMLGPGRIAFYRNRAFVLNSVSNTVSVTEVGADGKMRLTGYLQHPLLKRVYGIAIDKNRLMLAGREAKSFMIVDIEGVNSIK